MLGLVTTALSFSLPINARELYRQKVDIKIQCWTSILDCPSLSWRERENAFENLSNLYYEQYALGSKNNDTEVDFTWLDLDH